MMMKKTIRIAVWALVATASLYARCAVRTWTNTAGDGAWDNLENWADGIKAEPGDIALVSITGDTTLSITNEAKVGMFWTSGTGTLTINPDTEGNGSIYADWGSGAYRLGIISNAVSTVYNVPVKMRMTNYQVYPTFAANAVFNCKVTLTGGATWIPSVKKTGLVVQFKDEVDATDQYVYLNDASTTACKYEFYGKVIAKTLGQDNNSGNTIEFYGTDSEIGTLTAERLGKVNLQSANALSEMTVLQVGQYDKGGCLNVVGPEQVANRLTANSASVSASTGSDNYCVKASSACVLTLKGSESSVTTTGLTGPLSLVWDPTDDFTQSFTNRTLTTSGSITVNRGAVALTGTSSAPNLTHITVRSGATFRFQTSVALPLTAGKCVATVEAGGVIEVGEGVTAIFADVMYAGKHQKLGTYAALDARDVEEGTAKVSWVTGSGRVRITESTTFYWTGETGKWSEAASWTCEKVPDDSATSIVLDAISDEDQTLTVDEPLTISVPISVGNGGLGHSVLAIDSAVKVNMGAPATLMVTVGVGGEVIVGVGGVLTLDGTGRGMDSRYTSCRIDGGELKVAGGTVSFTNYPSCVDICGTSAHTGRVSMTAGDISFCGTRGGMTDDFLRLRFLEHSHADFSGGTYRFVTTTGCLRTLGDGGRIDVINATVSTLDSSSSDLQFGSGETKVGGSDGLFLVGKPGCNVSVAPTVASMPATLKVIDSAEVSGTFTQWTVGGSSGLSHLVWATGAALNVRNGLRVGCHAGFGRLDVEDGLLSAGVCGLQVAGTPAQSAYSLTESAEGALNVSGGALVVQGRDRSGYANYFSGLSVGDGTFTTLTGSSRPLKGALTLSGGVITNVDSHVMVGGGFAEGSWKQTGGALVDKKDLWIGAAGGLGIYLLSGGTVSVSGRLYVGGMEANRSSQVSDLCTKGIWPMSRHDADGALTVSGGKMTVADDCYLGYDGSGMVEMQGAGGELSVKNLFLSNQSSSIVKFTADADGVSPIKVNGKLTVAPGAKLVFDIGTASEALTRFKLIDCQSTDGSFADGDITILGENLKLVQTSTGVSVRRQRGLLLIVR